MKTMRKRNTVSKMSTVSLLWGIMFLGSAQALYAQKLEVNPEESTIGWMGKKVGGQHDGYIQLKSGFFELEDDRIAKGEFVVDMTSITNSDLKEGSRERLVNHLKSDDFFGVEKYPTASFKVTNSSTFNNGKATLTGEMNIKDKTENISFDVFRNENTYTAKIEIDRSKFDVRYGSDKFFDNLGDRAIDNIFTLDVTLKVR